MSLQVKPCVINLSCSWSRNSKTPFNKLQQMSKSDSSHCGQESYDIIALLKKMSLYRNSIFEPFILTPQLQCSATHSVFLKEKQSYYINL